ncbi:MAG TPA: beta-propeller fold lactonase family protein [Thermoleophilaceae bacterium]|jgi:6-phosphogluconolactonase (cycloisomerase 2 family)
MRIFARLFVGGAFALLALAGFGAASAGASPPPSPVVGHLYVNDNTAGANTIAGFNRHANGSLTPLPGSPFPAGGSGSGAPVASQGSLQESADGRFLLATDQGSNQVSVLRIRHDGSLAVVDVARSHGVQPVSIAVHRGLIYVANAGNGGSDYTGFLLDPIGRLHHLRGSTVPLPDGSQPGDILFNSTGTKVAGTRVGTSLIDSFRVRFDGRLQAAPGSPIPAQGLGPFGSEFRPTNPSQLFVSNAHDGAGNGTVSAYSVGPFGSLTSIGNSPFADHQTAPCWVEITHDGRFLFAVNTADSSVSRYAISPGGSLTLLGSTTLRTAPGLAPVDARIDPSGRTLSVVDGGGNAVSTFAVSGGDLTELASSPTPLPAGAHPAGIVVK